MPTYVYECSSCSKTFEVEQRITEAPLDACLCGSTGTVKRLIQPVGVMFKGPGFHVNDYAPKAKADKAPEATKPEAQPATPAAPAKEATCTGDHSSCKACEP